MVPINSNDSFNETTKCQKIVCKFSQFLGLVCNALRWKILPQLLYKVCNVSKFWVASKENHRKVYADFLWKSNALVTNVESTKEDDSSKTTTVRNTVIGKESQTIKNVSELALQRSKEGGISEEICGFSLSSLVHRTWCQCKWQYIFILRPYRPTWSNSNLNWIKTYSSTHYTSRFQKKNIE